MAMRRSMAPMTAAKQSEMVQAPSPSPDSMTAAPPCDVGGFSEIAERHKVYLHRAAVRLSADREVARDLVQETLARALLRFDKFEQGTNARAWLVTILSRLYLDHVKHEHVVARAKLKLVTSEVVCSDVDMAISSNRDEALWTAVAALEPDLRELVECCYIQDMSYKEIADKLQLPIGTVGTRLQRARQRLKELLTPTDAVKP
jgi:RNA polymerase sigma-70 factor, ECF subfamily